MTRSLVRLRLPGVLGDLSFTHRVCPCWRCTIWPWRKWSARRRRKVKHGCNNTSVIISCISYLRPACRCPDSHYIPTDTNGNVKMQTHVARYPPHLQMHQSPYLQYHSRERFSRPSTTRSTIVTVNHPSNSGVLSSTPRLPSSKLKCPSRSSSFHAAYAYPNGKSNSTLTHHQHQPHPNPKHHVLTQQQAPSQSPSSN